MRKLFVCALGLFGFSLMAIDEKNVRYSHSQRRTESPNSSRSLTPCASPESSDNESDEISSEESSDSEELFEDVKLSHESHTALQEMPVQVYLERFGSHFFITSMIILIAYKFYSAGYV